MDSRFHCDSKTSIPYLVINDESRIGFQLISGISFVSNNINI